MTPGFQTMPTIIESKEDKIQFLKHGDTISMSSGKIRHCLCCVFGNLPCESAPGTSDSESDCMKDDGEERESELIGLNEDFCTWYQSLKDYNARWPSIPLKKLYRGCRKIIKVFREEMGSSPCTSE